MANWAFANCSSFVTSTTTTTAVGATAGHLHLGLVVDCSAAFFSTSSALPVLGFVLLGYTCMLNPCLKNSNW